MAKPSTARLIWSGWVRRSSSRRQPPGHAPRRAGKHPPQLSNSPFITQLTPFDEFLLFVAFDPVFGFEIWRSDGTAPGTGRIVGSLPGINFPPPFGLERAGDRALFTTRESGFPGQVQELWVTDGTPVGSLPIPGASGPEYRPLGRGIQRIGATEGALLIASLPKRGFELWRSDPEDPALQLLPENNPGPLSSLNSNLSLFNLGTQPVVELAGRLYFPSNDPQVGSELHSLDLAALGLGGAEVFGEGCSSSGDGPCIDWSRTVAPGLSLELELSGAEPGAIGFALFSPGPIPNPLILDGCPIYLPNATLLVSVPVNVSGVGVALIGVPTAPQLLDQRLLLQWAATSDNGPLLGAFETSNALELLLATAP